MPQRLYYDDATLTTFVAEVTDIRELSRANGQSLWQIALDRSAFYPTSGGQPFDTGTLEATARSGAKLEVPIVEVLEDEAGEVWHVTAKPLLAGTRVEGRVDSARRRDHMQQHTGQHLLSAAFIRECKAPTVSFHLGAESSTIDLATEKLSDEQIVRVERLANEIVAEDRSVSLRSVARAEAEALLASGKLRKLPEREGIIRMVEIADFDLNACGGTHVRSTGEIGGLLIRKVEKAGKALRVEFVCGLRAVDTSRRDFTTLSAAAVLLSSAPSNLPGAIAKLLAENKAAAKDSEALLEEIARYMAAEILAAEIPNAEIPAAEISAGRSQAEGSSAFQDASLLQDSSALQDSPLLQDASVVKQASLLQHSSLLQQTSLIQKTLANRDLAFLKLLARNLVKAFSEAIVLLASTQAEPAAVLLARGTGASSSLHCGNLLREELAALGSRGGGSTDMAQGAIPAAQLEDLMARIRSRIVAG